MVEGDNQEGGVVVGDSVSGKTMKHDFAEPERDKPRWNQIKKLKSSPGRFLKMAKTKAIQSKKKCSKFKSGIKVTKSDLGLTTLDSKQESHLVGHGSFK